VAGFRASPALPTESCIRPRCVGPCRRFAVLVWLWRPAGVGVIAGLTMRCRRSRSGGADRLGITTGAQW